MKKFYLGVVCLIFVSSGFSQVYWVGGASGNWNATANWSAASGGPGGAAVPSSASNVIFNTAASVNIDVNDVNINSLTITNSKTVKLTSTSGDVTFQVNSTNSGAPALKIDALSRLEDSCNTGTTFNFSFGEESKSVVNGAWYFAGASPEFASFFSLPPTTGHTTRLDVNSGGAITITDNAFIMDNDEYLHFNANSSLILNRSEGGGVPKADYDDASNVFLTGFTSNSVVINDASIGNLIYDCPAQQQDISLSLFDIRIGGNLRILNTNHNELSILAVQENNDNIDLVVDGNLEVQGNSVVTMVPTVADISGKTINFSVVGNVILNGASFAFPSQSVDNPSTLSIGGNFQHTSGAFLAASSSTSPGTTAGASYFVMAFNGSSAQTISSISNSIDNGTHEVSLKINNPAGVTLLTPLTVGKLNLTAGKLTTTSTNVLTVNNATNNTAVVYAPSATSFVNGPVRRRTAAATSYLFPTGKGSAASAVTIIPATTTVNTFEATSFNTAYSDVSVLSPLSAVADNQYYEVKRIAGAADAAIQFALSSAINGANAADALVVASYDGTDWVNAKGATGTMLTPGNSTSGTVRSDMITSFDNPSRFTIGYGLAAVLPINLVTFNAKKVEANNAEISWKVTDNSTPVRFEVMKSVNGVTFTAIGTVQAAEGKLSYALTDKELAPGNNYYRLRMYDKDGSITYSNIVVVMNGTKGVLISSMMPTIVTDRARLNVSSSTSGKIELVITDISGRIVQQQTAEITTGNQQVWLNANRLAAGMYQVTGYMSGEKTKTFRFIKQ